MLTEYPLIGGFGTVRLAVIKSNVPQNTGNISEDLDDIQERSLKKTKGRKISKSIEHISTTGTSGNNSVDSDAVMKSDGSGKGQIEESKFAPASKKRAPSPKVFNTMALNPKR